MWPWEKSERGKWATPLSTARTNGRMGLPSLDWRTQQLYGETLPRGVMTPRFMADRPPFNYWMAPEQLAAMHWVPGQIVLGKIAGTMIGHMDDRPLVTIAGSRAGKTSTVLEPNLYLYPGSMLVLDPKCELAQRSAAIRRALGHQVIVLDPFHQSGLPASMWNALEELGEIPYDDSIIDDVAGITQALIVDDPNGGSRHWNDSARVLLQGIILFTLTLPDGRDLVTVRQLLTLTHPRLLDAARSRKKADGKFDDEYFDENKAAIETLLKAMASHDDFFGGILAGIARRFLSTPTNERGSIFSTAAAQTDFLDSLPLREMSRLSDFHLSDLRSDRPTTIYLCLPVGRMISHYRWLRLVVQLACSVLERMGSYPRSRTPILFLMEEFAVLQHLAIMEQAVAYFPGFGIKLWCVLQDISQLTRYYAESAETFLGNAGLIQTFANGDEATLGYIARRLDKLIVPFELRQAFSRNHHSQLLMMEGEAPAAAIRLEHDDVEEIRNRAIALAWELAQTRDRP